MARDEMLEITDDRWDEDIWGTASASEGGGAPKVIFYFGQSDHWVADHARDELIASRGNVEGENKLWKPKMSIDDEGIPHGFCIRELLKLSLQGGNTNLSRPQLESGKKDRRFRQRNHTSGQNTTRDSDVGGCYTPNSVALKQ